MLVYLSMLETAEEKSKFEQIYNSYKHTMMYTAYNILNDWQLSEDAVHEAFLRIARNFGKVGEISSPQTKGFVVVITRNVALSMVKRRSNTYIYEDEETINNTIADTSDDVFSKINFEAIVSKIISLPDIYKDVLYLYLVNEYNTTQISRILHLSKETVKKRLQRGRKILIENLTKEGITNE